MAPSLLPLTPSLSSAADFAHSLQTPKQSGSQSAVGPLKHTGSDWSRGVHVTSREKERGRPCLQKSAKNVRTRNRAPQMKYESTKACVIGKMFFFWAAMSKMHIIWAIQLGNQFSVHVQMYNLLKNAEMWGERIRIAMKGAPTLFFYGLHIFTYAYVPYVTWIR